ncbi:DNA-directed RNA polymerase [archaeon]|jgi:DNA-directed RNA polymerase subunit E'|nr:DNA-directed RNA polymerase [archaeon]MBT7128673.1 DNA-directed RNA polymerase [archaeon]
MFSIVKVTDHVRVEPNKFGMDTDAAVRAQLEESYSGFQDKDIGTVVAVLDVKEVKEGIIIPGDGAAYYESTFKLIVFRPELQELVYGTIEEITNFGAFISMGPIRGMIHISQTMDDFVSFSDSGVLTGKDGKKNLVQGDKCIARIVAISYKGEEPKIGLTMRQPGLGKLDWIKAEKEKTDAIAKQALALENKKEKKK